MDIAIVGAGGDCGREIAMQLVAERVQTPFERLQLVGHHRGPSARTLFGLRSDLMDAYAEIAPELDVALSPDEVTADVVVVVAGATMPADVHQPMTRADLAAANMPLFEQYARALAEHGHGSEIVIVVTNPVELGVEIFSQYLDRRRVIGLGAYMDTLRFRRELAADLGVGRQMVHGFMVGEHGEGMMPLWSSVRVFGLDEREELPARVRELQAGRRAADFTAELARERAKVVEMLRAGQTRQVFDYGQRLPPDLRSAVLTYSTHMLSKTVIATASMAVDLVRTLVEGRETVVAGQVRLEGEWYGLRTSIGAPVVLNNLGWSQVVPLELWDEEVELLQQVGQSLTNRLREWRHA